MRQLYFKLEQEKLDIIIPIDHQASKNSVIELQNKNYNKNKIISNISNVSTPSNIDKSFQCWMYHFQPDYENPDQNIDNDQIKMFSLNVCTLTEYKLEIILDQLKDKRNYVYILTEININMNKFDKMKNKMSNNMNYSIMTKVLEHVNGGILILWDNGLKIKPSPSLKQQSDSRIVQLEFKPNSNLKILIIACQLPTVDLQEWQHIANINPGITIPEINNQSDRKEYEFQQNQINNVLSRDLCEYEHIVIIGDLNLHYISTNPEEEQPKYIIQKNLFNQSISERRFVMKEQDPNNSLNQTYFKGDKNSILDYVFCTRVLNEQISKTVIFNDSMISTDHNVISVNLNLAFIEKINQKNINRKTFVNSSLLTTDEGQHSYVSSLSEFDVSNANLKDIILYIKQPLIQKCPDNLKFYIDDAKTKTLRKIKKQFMRIKRYDLATLTCKRMKKQVKSVRRIKMKTRIDKILSDQKSNLREWWKLTTKYVKPKNNSIQLSENNEGFKDINTTLDSFKHQFKNLQQRKVQVDEIEHMEDWIALFFVKYYPPGIFKNYSEFIEQKVRTNEQIGIDSLEIFMGIQNFNVGLDQGFNDIILSKRDSIGGVEGVYFKPFTGIKVAPEELNAYIKLMKSHKAPGFDNVDARILKNLPEEQILRLSTLYNNMMDHSQIDEDLKQVIITLLSKNDNPQPTPEDFRPISLLSIPCFKLIEKIILARILLSSNVFQFGFKKYNSTVDMLKVLEEILESCKNKQPSVGLFSLGMYDQQKAFNSVYFLKLIARLDTRGVDKNMLALLLNLFMPQKVFFKIGDNLSTEAISLNLQCGHQGSCFMPLAFTDQVSEFVDEIERRESNLLQVEVPNGIKFSNELMFADDYNEADYFPKYTRANDISNQLSTHFNHFKEKSRTYHLNIAPNKCKHLTNDTDKLSRSISNWSDFEITNKAKLLGVRFKLKHNLELCQKDQFNYIKDKTIKSFEKLKIAQKINKFLTSKQGVNMAKSFCIPVIDQNNVNNKFTQTQSLKLDTIIYKNIKHMLGFRQTSLSINFQVCFNVLNYSDRKNICEFFFLLKHYDTNTTDLNACTNVLQSRQSVQERNEHMYECLGDLDLTGIKEQFIEIGQLENAHDFDASQMQLLEFISMLHIRSKMSINKSHVQTVLKQWIKKLFKLRIMMEQIDQNGEQTMAEMRLQLQHWRIDTMHVEYLEGAHLLKNHTAWQVLRYWDFDSTLNCFELNNVERKLEKRFLKLMFCSQRLAYRIKVITTNQRDGVNLTWGTCNMCNQLVAECETHFLRYCPQQDGIRACTYNTILPLTNFRLSYNSFVTVLDLQLYGSYEMLRRAFGDDPENEFEEEFVDQTVKTHKKFNREMKIMLVKMLDVRKDRMLSLRFEERTDIPLENIERQKQQCELQKWRQ